MTGFSEMGTGFLMMLLMNYVLSIMWLVDSFTLLEKVLNLIMVREKTDFYFSVNVAMKNGHQTT